MPKKLCIVTLSDGKKCSRFRSPQYIDYCYTCGKAGRRKDCVFVSPKGQKCPRKVKKGDYCGLHKDLGIKIVRIKESMLTEERKMHPRVK